MMMFIRFVIRACLTLLLHSNLSSSSSPSHPDTINQNALRAHPNLPGLSATGKELENVLQKHINDPSSTMLPSHKRYVLLANAARGAEKSRNHWHKEKERLNEKLQKSGRKIDSKIGNILRKIPGFLESKYQRATRKRNEGMQTLIDIAKDSAIHQQHGHLIELHTKRINRMKFSQSRDIGYITPKASPPRDPSRNSDVKIEDLPPSP